MRFCPGCGACLDGPPISDGWHTARESDRPAGSPAWRVAEWKNGQPTGRLTRIYDELYAAVDVRDALNLFYRS